MAYLVERDNEGRLIYVCESFLVSSEKNSYDKLLFELRKDIPTIEDGLEKEYKKSIYYKYFLGKFLGDALKKYEIKESERKMFWDEIKDFASNKNRKRNDGSVSKTRSFYEQCYILSQLSMDIVLKMSWRQWQNILDRIAVREDRRIFSWIGYKSQKIREDDWREFVKALNYYLIKKDTSVFNDQELFSIYNELYDMAVYWRIEFSKFEKLNPKSLKVKSKSRRSRKFYSNCLNLKRERRQTITDEICKESFEFALK